MRIELGRLRDPSENQAVPLLSMRTFHKTFSPREVDRLSLKEVFLYKERNH